MFTAVLGAAIGAGMSMQSAINSRLRVYVLSPFIASMISFIIGTIFLSIIVMVNGLPLTPPAGSFTAEPAWIWLGGVCGVIALTTNIFIFPKIGSVETAIMPIIGMIITGMAIDHFGWFNSYVQAFSLNRLFGVLLIFAGVFLAVVLQDIIKQRRNKLEPVNSSINKWPWRAAGFTGGALLSVQAAINGELGAAVNSPFTASFISFFVGADTLIIIVLVRDKTLVPVKYPVTQKAPLWVWLGGIFGGFYVLINIFLVGEIGTGPTVVLVLFGQIFGSLLVQQFGLFKSAKVTVVPVQLIGLMIMLAGVVMINLF